MATTALTIANGMHDILVARGSKYPLDWGKELRFLKELFDTSSFLGRVALENQASLEAALLTMADTGLSLNPALRQAYLLPFKTQNGHSIRFMPSYLGLETILARSGIVQSIAHDSVFEHDKITIEANKAPRHSYNPFGARGRFLGVYAYAILTNGAVVTVHQDAARLEEIKMSSESMKKAESQKYSPWVRHETEMQFKTVIRLLCKHILPMVGSNLGDSEVKALEADYADIEAEHGDGGQVSQPAKVDQSKSPDEFVARWTALIEAGADAVIEQIKKRKLKNGIEAKNPAAISLSEALMRALDQSKIDGQTKLKILSEAFPDGQLKFILEMKDNSNQLMEV